MFEMAPVGIPIAVAGLIYMWSIGTRLIPARGSQKPAPDIGHRKYQADVVVLAAVSADRQDHRRIAYWAATPGSRWSRSCAPANRSPSVRSRTKLRAGDLVVLEGLRADVLKVKEMPGVELKADAHLADPETPRGGAGGRRRRAATRLAAHRPHADERRIQRPLWTPGPGDQQAWQADAPQAQHRYDCALETYCCCKDRRRT